MSNKYLITVSQLNEDTLQKDKLVLSRLPEALNSSVEKLAPAGSLDLALVYLVPGEEYAKLLAALEKHSVPYPRDQKPASNGAQVIRLSDRRKPV